MLGNYFLSYSEMRHTFSFPLPTEILLSLGWLKSTVCNARQIGFSVGMREGLTESPETQEVPANLELGLKEQHLGCLLLFLWSEMFVRLDLGFPWWLLNIISSYLMSRAMESRSFF